MHETDVRLAGDGCGCWLGWWDASRVMRFDRPSRLAMRPGERSLRRLPTAALDPATLGTVSGTVHFAGKAPQRVKIDMSMDPVCSMMGGDNFAEQFVVQDGKLANVYVYVKRWAGGGDDGSERRRPTPVVMDQVGCRYMPHVIAVMRGGSVEFRNSDATMHNIHTMPAVAGNETIDISQGAEGRAAAEAVQSAGGDDAGAVQ